MHLADSAKMNTVATPKHSRKLKLWSAKMPKAPYLKPWQPLKLLR